MKKLFLFAILGLASSAYAQVSISGTGVQVGGTGTGCPTSGCTLTGPLSGTSATFSGTVATGTTVTITLDCDGATDNSTTISDALSAYKNIKFAMSSGSTCLMNTPQAVPSTVNSLDFTGVTISGTPSTDSPLFSVSSPITVTGGTFANHHTTGNPYWQYVAWWFGVGSDGSMLQNATLTAGRGLIKVVGPDVGLVSNIQIINPRCTGATDFCVDISGNGIVVDNAVISGTVTSGYLGPPHDINAEDCTNCIISNPIINDGTGMTESGASCIQVYPNHWSVNGTQIINPNCTKTGGATYPAVFAWAAPGDTVTVQGGSFSGYSIGINSQANPGCKADQTGCTNYTPGGVVNISGTTITDTSTSINGILYASAYPTYSSGTTYWQYAAVQSGSPAIYYYSLVSNNTGNTPASSPSDWQPVEPVYSSGTTYAAGSLVQYNGVFYVSLQSSNTGNTPASYGSAYWNLYRGSLTWYSVGAQISGVNIACNSAMGSGILLENLIGPQISNDSVFGCSQHGLALEGVQGAIVVGGSYKNNGQGSGGTGYAGIYLGNFSGPSAYNKILSVTSGDDQSTPTQQLAVLNNTGAVYTTVNTLVANGNTGSAFYDGSGNTTSTSLVHMIFSNGTMQQDNNLNIGAIPGLNGNFLFEDYSGSGGTNYVNGDLNTSHWGGGFFQQGGNNAGQGGFTTFARQYAASTIGNITDFITMRHYYDASNTVGMIATGASTKLSLCTGFSKSSNVTYASGNCGLTEDTSQNVSVAKSLGLSMLSTNAIGIPMPVKANTAGTGQVIATTTSDTGSGVVLGVCLNTPVSAGGTCDVATTGLAALTMGTGTCAIGQFVIVDTTTGGDVKCTSTYAAGTVIGVAVSAQTTVGSAVNTVIGLK